MSKKWSLSDLHRVADNGLSVNLGAIPARLPIRYVIGVDPGKNTGIAIWDKKKQSFTEVSCMLIHQALETVKKMAGSMDVLVRVEDARQRKWFGKSGREKLQGAGSAKRDSTIWEDFLTDQGIPFELVPPKNNKTKVSADYFKKVTGWSKRTNEHARDAGMLCWRR